MKRLKNIFRASALGLAIVTASAATAFAHGASNWPFLKETQSWNEALQGDNIEYKRFGHSHSFDQKRPLGRHSYAVQIETGYPEIGGLILSPYRSPLAVIERHGEAAAQILFRSSSNISSRNISTHYVKRFDGSYSWLYNPYNPLMRSLFENADVVSLSMNIMKKGSQENQFSGGFIDDPGEIVNAWNFWNNSRAIMVWSAGNSGLDGAIDLERQDALHPAMADTMVRIGEAMKVSDKKTDEIRVYINPISSRAGVSLVTANPFSTGFSYRYKKEKEALLRSMEKIYTARDRKTGKPYKAIFAERLKTTPLKQVQKCHPAFDTASFAGKEFLLNDMVLRREHPEKIRQAFMSCIVEAAAYLKKFDWIDEDGFIGGLAGSSFSGPEGAGYIVGMHERYPHLSEHVLVAAALIAAEPVTHIWSPDEKHKSVQYRDNGRGLPHNDREAGFGYLSSDAYKQTVTEMAQMLDDNPALKTQETWAMSQSMTYQDISSHFSDEDLKQKEYIDHALPVFSDITALRTNLIINFGGTAEDVPEKISLISPSGAVVELSPSKLEGPRMEYSLASTDGFFGNHTKGTWKIRVPDPLRYKIKRAELWIAGVEKGGLIDSYLEQKIGPVSSPVKKPAIQEKRQPLP